MWTRNEAQPTDRNGIHFRSKLEAAVAEQLETLGIKLWEYELPYRQIEGMHSTVQYLPDFTIWEENSDPYHLPLWLEVKPAGLLYAMRDDVNLPERFGRNQSYNWPARQIRNSGYEEIWKPKQLAEDTGQSVLVVSALNRNQTLSILLTPDHVEFSRSHPAVNWKQIIRDQEKAERDRQWREKMERLQTERRQQVITEARTRGRQAARDDICILCRNHQPASQLIIYKSIYGWAAVCRAHLA